MSYGHTPKDAGGIPMGSGYVAGQSDLPALRLSPLAYADSSSNTSAGILADLVREAVLNGQAYHALFDQTIGGAAQGFYSIAVYNPNTSGKNILFYSIRGWINGGASIVFVLRDTANPALTNGFTPLNVKAGGPSSALTSTHVTYNSASGGISFPGTTKLDHVCGPVDAAGEVLTNGESILLPSGSNFSIQMIMFVTNSKQYGQSMKWIEF